ncbi:MAG: hypothetical protein IH631_09570, partial [Candidatus Thorarchaeota archaeon]|nr:hypothetical protein [Candidatus Thorarchaeota archaeon]
MDKRNRVYAAIGIVIILFGLFFATLPQERLLIQKEYTSFGAYPAYYYTNFTVASSDLNAELSLVLDIDAGNNYTSSTTFFILYRFSLEQFEDSFNSTIVREAMMGGDWDVDDFDAFWGGWFSGISNHPAWEPIP